MMGVGSFVSARLVQRYGERGVVVAAAALAMPFCLGLLVPSVAVAAGGYMLTCFLIGMVFPYMDVLLFRAVATQQRGVVKSISTMSWSLGWSLAAYLSGLLQQNGAWTTLIVVSSFGYVMCAVAFKVVPFSPVARRESVAAGSAAV
jgi:predicted MFS family arabinose efflux permease